MLKFRRAQPEDCLLYFKWSNDPDVRSNSFSSEEIVLQEHKKWFEKKLADPMSLLLIFLNTEGIPVGQVRIDQKQKEFVIGISVAKEFRGKGLAAEMIQLASDEFRSANGATEIVAYVKKDNFNSRKAFIRAGFRDAGETTIGSAPTYRLVYD